MDLVGDYERRATRLVEQYEQARKEKADSYTQEMHAKNKMLLDKLTKWSGEIGRNLGRTSVITEMTSVVREEQEMLMARIQEAITKCQI